MKVSSTVHESAWLTNLVSGLSVVVAAGTISAAVIGTGIVIASTTVVVFLAAVVVGSGPSPQEGWQELPPLSNRGILPLPQDTLLLQEL